MCGNVREINTLHFLVEFLVGFEGGFCARSCVKSFISARELITVKNRLGSYLSFWNQWRLLSKILNVVRLLLVDIYLGHTKLQAVIEVHSFTLCIFSIKSILFINDQVRTGKIV